MQLSSVESIVVLTGAGISAESGIKTFRDNNGLWENHRVEDVASPQGFAADPVLVHRFYNMRRHTLLYGGIEPNPAHLALAKLDREFTGEFLLVTQNIDNLHERAGSVRLLHMHGEILKMRCSDSGQIYPIDRELSVEDRCECCNQPGRLRPQRGLVRRNAAGDGQDLQRPGKLRFIYFHRHFRQRLSGRGVCPDSPQRRRP